MNFWTVLAEPTRREIFDRLADRPRSVGEIAEALPISRPAVSQHLKVLKDAGLITDAASGKQRIYSVNPAGLEALKAELDLFWNRTLTAFRSSIVQLPEKEP